VSGRRPDRLAEEIREEVAKIIGHRLKDPRIGFVTVTRVELAGDLRTAKVLVGVLGDAEQRRKTLSGLRQASGFVRREIGRVVRMRHTPEITFQYDTGIEAADRVSRILGTLEGSQEADDPEGDGEE
jgi:ribosome-binding factor A